MNPDTSDSDVQQFYAEAQMSEDRIDAILSHGHSVASARMWKRLAAGSMLALAAMVLVCVNLVMRLQEGSGVAVAPTMEQEIAKDAPPPAEIPRVREPNGQGFRLIAVRNHGDRCPHCRASGQMFANLKESLSDQPIEFTFIDLRRGSEGLEQSQREFDSLKLDELVAGVDKALLAFADAAGNLHRLDVSSGPDRLRRQILGMLSER